MAGQTAEWDASGTSRMEGAFVFRHLVFDSFNAAGHVAGARAEYGTIEFDGEGRYSIDGTYIASAEANGAARRFQTSGEYRLGSNGFGYIANPTAPDNPAERIHGAFAQAIFSGTATEGGVVDMFVAIPLGAGSTTGDFSSDYWVASISFPGATEAAIKNARFRLQPDGSGGIGPIEFMGRAADRNPPAHTQTVAGATYSFVNGQGRLDIPAPNGVAAEQALVAGPRTFYLSADRSFLLGYSPDGYDIMVGVRALTRPANASIFRGTYFLTALEVDIHEKGIDSFYGSEIDGLGDGHSVMHQRVGSNRFDPWDYVIDNHTDLAEDGTDSLNWNGYSVAFGNEGRAFVAVHRGAYALLIGTHSSEMDVGGAVMLHPLGVMNSASFAPITTPVAPGELISLFGRNLARSRLVVPGGQAFPKQLGGVRVLFDGEEAAIFGVSPDQVVAVVPYGLRHEGHPATEIRVENNGVLSNPVTMFVTDAMPGIFTQSPHGRGFAIALRENGSLATPENPAHPGEILTLFLTGLGRVTPDIEAGEAAPRDGSLHRAALWVNSEMEVSSVQPTAIFNPAAIVYAGLAPGFAGLYQLNVRMPPRAGPGDQVHIEVITESTSSRQYWVPVAAADSNTQ